MRKASTKDILRTIKKEKKRFISIMMITVLGVTLMTGLKAGCGDLRLSADRFYDSQRLFDISIMSTLGLTEEDVLAIQRMEEVEKAEGTFSEIVHTKKGDVNKTAEIKIVRENGLNVPYVLEGRLPAAMEEIVVSENYLKETGKSLGDRLTIEEIMEKEEASETMDESLESANSETVDEESETSEAENEISLDVDSEVELEEEETPNFPQTEFTIVGTVIDVMDINNAEGSAAFRATPNADYTFFVTSDAVESDIYTAVYVALEGSRELLCYSGEYEEKVEAVTYWIETEIMEQRELARHQQITGEAYEKIAEKEAEMLDAFAEVEAEFLDAEEEIADARKEIQDGWKKIRDGWKELEDGRQELIDGRQELEDGRKELEDGKLELADAEREAKEEIANARKELEDANKKLNEAWARLNDAEKELNIGQAQLEEGKKELTIREKEAKEKLDKAEALLNSEVSKNKKTLAELEGNLSQMKSLFGTAWSDVKEIELKLPGSEQQNTDTVSLEQEEEDENIPEDVPENMPESGIITPTISISLEEAWKMYVNATKKVVMPVIASHMGSDTSVDEEQVKRDVGNAVLEAQKDVEIHQDGSYGYGIISYLLSQVLAENINDLQGIIGQLGGEVSVQNLITLATGIATCNATTDVLQGAKDKFEAEKESALAKIAAAWDEIYRAEAELESGREQLSRGRKEVSDNYQKWKDGVKELDENEQKALQEIADKWVEIAEGEQELLEGELKLQDGERELIDGEKDLIKGERKLRDGEVELLEGEQELADYKAEYQEERAKAEDKIAEAKQKVADIDMTKWYVQDRTSLSGYVNVDSDTASIESLATVFTVVFFVVAILISLTTVTRMVEEERGLIGTYKALGFTDSEIRRKYVIYALGASVLGSILGDVGGFVILPEILFVFFRVMYLFPVYILKFEAVSGTLSGIFFIIGITGAAVVACYSELKHVAAHLMRPKAPKEGSRVFLEYIKPLWKRMSFLNKVTARNLFRYKKRMFMTLFGIMGCTALLVFGLAIKDSVSELMPLQYENVYSYDLLAATSADDNEKLISYMEGSKEVTEYLNIQVESVKLKNENRDSEKVQLMILPDGADISKYFNLKNENEEPITIGENGIYVTENACKILGFKVGDEVYIQRLDLSQETVQITSLVKNYLGNNIYMSQTAYEEVFGEYEPNGILANLSDSCIDQIGFSDKLAEEDWILSSISTEDLKGTFSQAFTLINLVVYVVLVLAACLAFVVLFTLASINISERERELATIKVLGFYDKEVHSYVNKETIILTVIGILIGLPVGAMLSSMLTDLLNMPSIYFAVTIYGRSYFIAAGIALGFALIVQFLTDRSLDVINPVEALKSVE